MVATLLDAPAAPDVLLQEALVEVGLAAIAALVHRPRGPVHALHVRLQDLPHLEDLVAVRTLKTRTTHALDHAANAAGHSVDRQAIARGIQGIRRRRFIAWGD